MDLSTRSCPTSPEGQFTTADKGGFLCVHVKKGWAPLFAREEKVGKFFAPGEEASTFGFRWRKGWHLCLHIDNAGTFVYTWREGSTSLFTWREGSQHLWLHMEGNQNLCLNMKGRQAPLFAPCSLPTMYFCRAQENGQLLGKVEKERGLLRQELFARIKVATELHCTELHCTLLHCTTLHCTMYLTLHTAQF